LTNPQVHTLSVRFCDVLTSCRYDGLRSRAPRHTNQTYPRRFGRNIASPDTQTKTPQLTSHHSYTLRLLTRHPNAIISHDAAGLWPRIYGLAPWSPVLTGSEAYFQPLNLIPTPLIKIQHQIVRPSSRLSASLKLIHGKVTNSYTRVGKPRESPRGE
jgi:hypothetical protein